MSINAKLRRSRVPLIMFCLCLSAVVMFPAKAISTQVVAQSVQQVPKPQITTPLPVTPPSLTQNVRKTVLENGLTVLTKEVNTAPVVTVQIWYDIGSVDETPGVNGIAHQLEHMLFKGTNSRPVQFGRLFNALGSESNAFTSFDKTAYFGTVEKNKLNALLVLEADRMQNALINKEALESEKRVVLSEMQGVENSPNYRLGRAVMRAAFPDKPYGRPVGGTKAEIENFNVEQVRYYYQNYYSPKNATLVIVGDFETQPTLKAVKEIFGKLRNNQTTAQTPPNPPTQSPTSNTKSQSPLVLRQPGSAPLVQVVYPLVPIKHPDVPALDLFDYILTSGRNSRLYQALVESGLASGYSGGAVNLVPGGWFELSATAAPGKDIKKIQQVMNETIATLSNKGVTADELNRAKTQLLANAILQNRNITSQAMQLANDQVTTGDYRYTERYLAAINQVKVEDIQRVAQKYLKPEVQTVGFFEPTEVKNIPSASTSSTAPTQSTENFNSGAPISPSELAKYLPNIEAQTSTKPQTLPQEITLTNGVKVLLLPDNSNPTVTLSGYVQAGTSFDTKTKAGVATLTAQNLMNGTKTKDALTLARILEERGARLSFGANREGVNVSGYALSADLPTLVQVFADVVQNATFPTDKLELSRQRALTGLKLELDNPSSLARRTFQQTVYPENHPLNPFPTEESLKGITRDDIVQFYQKQYRPNNTILTLVGNFDSAKVRSLLENQLASWKGTGKANTLTFPPVNLPEKVVQLNPVIPGKTQSVTIMGYKGIDRKDSRYYAALVLNEMLGGSTLSSRLGGEIRDRLGLTYGIYSAFQAGKYPGPFLISMQTAPEDAQKAIASTIALLRQIQQQGFSAEEIAAAKRSITSSYNVALANPDNLAGTILGNEVYGLTQEELRQFPSKIQALTPEQVNQVTKDLLHPNNLVVVTAGPPLAAAR